MMQVKTNPQWLRISIHSQCERSGQDAFGVSPFSSTAFSVSFSLARACFSDSETLCCNLTMASSALGQKHGSLNNNEQHLPFHESAKNGWDTTWETVFSSKPTSQLKNIPLFSRSICLIDYSKTVASIDC